MLEIKVLIVECLTIDAQTSCSIPLQIQASINKYDFMNYE